MSDSNLYRLSYVPETTLGTTPAIAGLVAMRSTRITGESLVHTIQNVVSDELRSDRQIPDMIQISGQGGGGINFELHHPAYRAFHDDMLQAALFNNWDIIARKHNITAANENVSVAVTTGIYTINSGGAAFLSGHVVMASGFTNAANNGIFTVSASTGTTVTTSNTSSVSEASPPVGATLEVLGIQGASADIAATTAGGTNNLTCTAADFVALGFKAGDYIKIGDASNAIFGFSNALLNVFARVVTVAAKIMTLDTLPSTTTWAADAGTGKTIRIFRSDRLINGIVRKSFTLERGYLDHTVPSYLVHTGMMVNELGLQLQAGAIIKGNYNFMGMGHSTSTTSLGTPENPSTEQVMSSGANVADLLEAGASQASPNLVNSLQVKVSNNLRILQAVGAVAGVGMGLGRCEVSGSLNAYFGNLNLYNKYVSGAETSLYTRTYAPIPSSVIASGQRVFAIGIPLMEYESGQASAGQSNSDIFAQLGFKAKRHPTFNASIILHRFSYAN